MKSKNEQAEYARNWRKNNPEKIKSHIQKYRKNNREKYRNYIKDYYKKNRQRINLKRRITRQKPDNKTLEHDRVRSRTYRQKYTNQYVAKAVHGCVLKIPDHVIGNMNLKHNTELIVRIKRINNDD